VSDFLTHLAARALAVPTLRPRTRFRFEPGSPAAEGPVFVETVAERVAPRIESPAALSATRPHGRSPAAEQRVDVAQLPARPVQPVDPSPRRRIERPVDAAPREHPQAARIENEHRQPERRDAAAPQRADVRAPRVEHIVEHETVTTVVRHEPASQAGTTPAPRHRYDDELPHMASAEVAAAVERQTIREIHQMPPRVVTHAAARRGRPPASASHDAVEPIIQVSIGRIEVRTARVSAAAFVAPRNDYR
jgi:hypothetical protein